METILASIGTFFVTTLLLALLAAIFCFPVMWLWNWLMPDIFGLTQITVFQAAGLFFLTGLLVKGS